MKTQPTRPPWPQPTEDSENGNVASAKESSHEKNCMEITFNLLSIPQLDSSTGTRTSIDYFLDKSNHYVQPVIKPNQNQKIKFDELIGKKIDFHGHIGIIEDVPNDNICWVHFEGEPLGSTRGIKMSDVLSHMYEIPSAGEKIKLADRFNAGKIRYTLIPVEAEEAEARVWMKGAEKYGEANWQKGLPFKSVLDSLQRHAKALQKGQLIDPETGEPHAAHIRCNAAMLIVFAITHPELNDLPKSDTP